MIEHRDRQDISDVINRFATGIDRRDFSLIRKVFADDCHVVIGDYGSFEGVDAIARFEEDSHAQAGQTLHRMTNDVIDVEGDQATARSYVDAWITRIENIPCLGGRRGGVTVYLRDKRTRVATDNRR